ESKYLFIVRVDSAQSLSQLKRLSRAYTGQPILGLMNPDTDTAALLSTLRAGACQIALMPLRVEDFQSALETVMAQFGHQTTSSQIIAISGVSEGCGATTIAINLSYAIATAYKTKTILAEFAVRLGRLAAYLELTPTLTTADILNEADRLDMQLVQQALVQVTDNFQVLAGPYSAISSLTPAPGSFGRLVELLRQLTSVLVVDMPYTFDDLYFETLAAAHQIVLVSDPTVPSLRALKVIWEAIEKRGIRGTRHCLINRYDPQNKMGTVEYLKKILGSERPLMIGDDPASFTAAANTGQSILQQAPRARAVVVLDQLARLVLGLEEKATVARTIRSWLTVHMPFAGKHGNSTGNHN
ncbi:hypothetical protein AYO44_16915, partial [Planctomycetaceae bacterium SCGC AG-212-F19]